MIGDFTYDVETFPNVFTMCIKPLGSPGGKFYEISDRRDDTKAMITGLCFVRRMIGFNNLGFDWPVVDFIITHEGKHGQHATAWEIYTFAMGIINSNDRFGSIIWQPTIAQIDLYRIHHFDNPAKSTSLKRLEFTMRSRSVKDLPFPVGTELTFDQIDILLNYNAHDVLETERFAIASAGDIAYRESLGPEWLNYNDTKIGKKFFENRLNAAGVATRKFGQPLQTTYERGFPLAPRILPFIEFHTAPFRDALAWFKSLHIVQTKGAHNRVIVMPSGFEIHLGLGGIHGSIDAEVVDGENIHDWDVEAYYPSVGIAHRVYPAHLGPAFADTWRDLKAERKLHAKGTSENKTLKLSCNGVFGDMISEFSCFRDDAAGIAITVNGQLMLCMLAEALSLIPHVRLIQVNTDGVTLQFPDSARGAVEDVYVWWQELTGMDLEANVYRRMFIRDVNNYIGEYVNGKRKRKGAYEYARTWSQNHSAMIVPRATEAYLVDGVDIEDFIYNHTDPWDFLLCTKVPRGSELWAGERQLQNITRYYISETGDSLVKVMPPLKSRTLTKKMIAEGVTVAPNGKRRIGVHAEGLAVAIGSRKGGYGCSICGEKFGIKEAFNRHNKEQHAWKVREVNEFDGTMPADIDHRYYIRQVEALVM